jgi:hypothetical protein
MAGVKLDGAGAQKMKTLEEAMVTLQTIHGHVERMAIEVKNQKGAGIIPSQIKRIAVPMQGQLKGQFGMIADMISAMILGSSRGGGDQQKVRVLREYVGQLRQALDMAATRVKTEHAVKIETAGGDD